MRLSLAAAIALALLARAGIARAECTEAGACASNEYCSIDDGGVVVTDGGAGVCTPEPCILASDCPNNELCNTISQPFQCVECISTADCPGTEQCDKATHTCFQPPEAGEDASSDEEAGSDDGGEISDATVPVTPHDASVPVTPSDASMPVALDAGPPDLGSLSGGACDCATVAPAHAALAAVLSPFALAFSLLARRRARRRRR